MRERPFAAVREAAEECKAQLSASLRSHGMSGAPSPFEMGNHAGKCGSRMPSSRMKILISVVALFVGFKVFGASYCVGPSATGSGSGADWSNLKAWSATPVRGDTWYLVNGSYASKTLSVAASGSTLITIKKATASNYTDITATGWSSSYANQATIASLTISSSYWLIDGQTGNGASVMPCDATSANYGFYISAANGPVQLTGSLSYVTIKHAWFYTRGLGCHAIYQVDANQGAKNYVTVSHCLFDGWNEVLRNGADVWNYTVYEYNVILNSEGDSSNHGNVFNAMWANLTDTTIRYNVFKGMLGDGISGIISGNNASLVRTLVYGNVFDNIPHCTYVLGANSGYSINNAVFYNNTVITCDNDDAGFAICGRTTGSGNAGANNLLYNIISVMYNSAWSGDYDAFYSCSLSSGTHKQVATGNPFVNYSGMDYRLGANTQAGTVLGSPYNVDPFGKERTTWTRGAFEYGSGGSSTTNAAIAVTPGSLNFGAVVTNTSSSNLAFTVKNAGGGTLAGTAGVAAPFSIVSGGTYSLGANQSQLVALRYTPTSAGTNSQTVTFTGGGGTTAVVTGVATAVANLPPVVSAISGNAADVDPGVSGIQIYQGSVVQYSGSASDPNGDALTWQWIYTVNGGHETVLQSGSGSVAPASFAYPANSAGSTYVWKLRINDGLATVESSLTVGLEAPPAPPGSLTFEAGAGTVTAPFVVDNGILYQTTSVADATSGGTATYNFTLANTGSFVIQALVSATNLANNSFYVNIDGAPQDPGMAWDILPVTSGFEQRMVSWRGSGTSDADQYVPQIFVLSAGNHQLIIKGREAYTQLQSFSILQLPSPPQNLHIIAGP